MEGQLSDLVWTGFYPHKDFGGLRNIVMSHHMWFFKWIRDRKTIQKLRFFVE